MSTSTFTTLDGDEGQQRLRQAFDMLGAQPQLHHLTAAVGPVELVAAGTVPSGDEWIGCSALIALPRWLTQVVVLSGERRHTGDPRIAGSLFVLGWSYWVLALPLGCLLWAGVVPDAGAAHMAMGLRGGYASRVAYPAPRVIDPGTGPVRARPELRGDDGGLRAAVAFIAETAVGGHLAPLIDALHEQMDVPRRLLWGNVASAAVRAVNTFAPSVRCSLGPVTDLLLDLSPHALRALLEPPRQDADQGSQWRRKTCCLFYQVDEDGRRCDDCSLSVDAVADYRTRLH